MVWKTFDDWSEAGYTINKGSKATWFAGVPKFSEKQVHRYCGWMYAEYDNDAFDVHWDYGFDPWGQG